MELSYCHGLRDIRGDGGWGGPCRTLAVGASAGCRHPTRSSAHSHPQRRAPHSQARGVTAAAASSAALHAPASPQPPAQPPAARLSQDGFPGLVTPTLPLHHPPSAASYETRQLLWPPRARLSFLSLPFRRTATAPPEVPTSRPPSTSLPQPPAWLLTSHPAPTPQIRDICFFPPLLVASGHVSQHPSATLALKVPRTPEAIPTEAAGLPAGSLLGSRPAPVLPRLSCPPLPGRAGPARASAFGAAPHVPGTQRSRQRSSEGPHGGQAPAPAAPRWRRLVRVLQPGTAASP